MTETAAAPRDPRGLPRWLEAAAAAALAVVMLPVVAAASAAIVLSTGKSPLFRQRRVGRGGRIFTLVKLRTMRPSRGGPDVTARGDTRVTGVGRILRKTKIDEIPELWNVVAGQMSFVGPRPEVPRYVDVADPRWTAVLRVRPGLTDPVTLRLRNEEEFLAAVSAGDREAFYRERLQPYKLNGYAAYLASRDWRSDMRVLRQTVRAVLRPGSAPPPSMSDVLAESLQTSRIVP